MRAPGAGRGALPRLVIAAPASGHGKTTVATGLMAALKRAGHVVSGHKVGPDYIDPGYHSLATGRPGRNLDPHLVGVENIAPLLLHGARAGGGAGPWAADEHSADLAIIEGVMGLFDGKIGGEGFASSAHVAALTQSPVVLVVDVSHASRTVGAMVQGLAHFDPAITIAGVILNKAGTQRHADEVRRAVDSVGIPVLGVLQRDDGIVAPSRHLGLVPAAERGDAAAALDRLSERIAERVDLTTLVEIARSAPDLDVDPWDPRAHVSPSSSNRPVVAVAGGRAFTFRYAETTELLEAAGCEVVPFDPLTDASLPTGTQGIYLGGGFPEVHAAGLSANTSLRHDLRTAILDGIPTVAECAGLLYLCRTVDDAPMVGALDADAVMMPRLTLAYRQATLPADGLLGATGGTATGHEFHRTIVTPRAGTTAAWDLPDGPEGFATDTLHASYLHTHWAGQPHLAQAFTSAVHASAPATRSAMTPSPLVRPAAMPGSARPADPLRWHGDQENGEGLVDLAVNVSDEPRPAWLHDALVASLDDAGSYPDAGGAERSVGLRHVRPAAEVLATAGAAEAFGLVARMRAWQRPVVVHPQFTEPDVALAAAGHTVTHVVTSAEDGFALDPASIPDDADLVIVGNPTNPTGVLHPESTIRALLAPGRLVVVDEAFMDSVPGERGSVASLRLPGLLVVRSLTKLWAIPGVRAGYVLGDAGTVAELRTHQTPWAVSAAAIAALRACSTSEALAEAAARADRTVQNRRVLTDGLTELGIDHTVSAGPFVLVRAGAGAHESLRAAGFATRRADTFPGLDDTWLRLAVRRPHVSRRLLGALRLSREGATA
ncbi:cobyrinic acid a,c-diamide synthase [Aeromicrobium sp. Root495]|uniref:cobyrinate a,c-diamide synthase n=1 Tax=Aeromicrobium sp. Root495 TaxID=1736550 RepID=UPI0006FF3A52|nr:cobyrinate a,c-diamide synthase [Aeromicrobium sp. Root495]KQY60487.1 cobyrinic acid a,c-diamide synthase [Aeromicrobium sp. Root495]